MSDEADSEMALSLGQAVDTISLPLEITSSRWHVVEYENRGGATSGEVEREVAGLGHVRKYLIFVCLDDIFLWRDGREDADELSK